MAKKVVPTRGTLVTLQSETEQARRGHDLLEQKRQALMMELMKHIDEAKSIQSEVADIFSSAYRSLQLANISLGIDTVEDVAASVPRTEDITVRLRSVMGVEIPDIDEIDTSIKPTYSLFTSTSAMDEAYMRFRSVLDVLLKLAETETSVYRLAVQIRKTGKRVNALDKIVIPAQTALIRSITDVLEEGDREDFTRMKAAKNLREKKKAKD